METFLISDEFYYFQTKCCKYEEFADVIWTHPRSQELCILIHLFILQLKFSKYKACVLVFLDGLSLS